MGGAGDRDLEGEPCGGEVAIVKRCDRCCLGAERLGLWAVLRDVLGAEGADALSERPIPGDGSVLRRR